MWRSNKWRMGKPEWHIWHCSRFAISAHRVGLVIVSLRTALYMCLLAYGIRAVYIETGCRTFLFPLALLSTPMPSIALVVHGDYYYY